MFVHIVMWRLADSAEGRSKTENAQKIKQDLEALADRIPGILKLQVYFNQIESPRASDVVLVSEFESKAAFRGYQDDSNHQAVKAYIGLVTTEARVVDYEIPSMGEGKND